MQQLSLIEGSQESHMSLFEGDVPVAKLFLSVPHSLKIRLVTHIPLGHMPEPQCAKAQRSPEPLDLAQFAEDPSQVTTHCSLSFMSTSPFMTHSLFHL